MSNQARVGAVTSEEVHGNTPLFRQLSPHLEKIQNSIGTIAADAGESFERARQGAIEEQALARMLLGAFGVTDGVESTSHDAETTMARMLSRMDEITAQLDDALVHLERVLDVLQRALRVNAELRRTGRVSRFLAAQATIESTRTEAELQRAFGANATRVRELADSSTAACESIEYNISILDCSIKSLRARIKHQSEALSKHKRELRRAEMLVLSSFNAYSDAVRKVVDGFAKSNTTVLNCIYAAIQGLQFEDISLQLLEQVRLAARHENLPPKERVVMQESMSEGDIELF